MINLDPGTYRLSLALPAPFPLLPSRRPVTGALLENISPFLECSVPGTLTGALGGGGPGENMLCTCGLLSDFIDVRVICSSASSLITPILIEPPTAVSNRFVDGLIVGLLSKQPLALFANARACATLHKSYTCDQLLRNRDKTALSVTSADSDTNS